jgi:biopolymer transport protein ExbB/TolQ
MIRSFNVIATAGPGNLPLVATGIAEALIATAAGLTVGIPTFAAYHFLRGRADQLVILMEEISIGFVEDIAQRKNSGQDGEKQ